MGLLDKFKRNKEKWQLIDNLHQLPIGKYLQIIEIGKSEMSEIDKSTAILEILTGWSANDIEQLPLPTYSALVSGCGWLYEEPKPVQVEKSYKIGDFDCRVTDAKKITTAQYIDFQTYGKDMDAYIVEVLSIVLVPKGKRYGEGYDIEQLRKWIAMYLPTDTALSLIAFFLLNAQQSMLTILTSSVKTIQQAPAKTMKQMRDKATALAMVKHLQQNGGGF